MCIAHAHNTIRSYAVLIMTDVLGINLTFPSQELNVDQSHLLITCLPSLCFHIIVFAQGSCVCSLNINMKICEELRLFLEQMETQHHISLSCPGKCSVCVCEHVSRLSLLYENTPVFSGLKVARFSDCWVPLCLKKQMPADIACVCGPGDTCLSVSRSHQMWRCGNICIRTEGGSLREDILDKKGGSMSKTGGLTLPAINI